MFRKGALVKMKDMNKDSLIPLIPTRGIVAFPKGIVSVEVSRKKSVAAIKSAIKGAKKIFIVAQKFVDVSEPAAEDLYAVGTVCEIKQFQKYSDGDYKLTAVGKYKARINKFYSDEAMFTADVRRISERVSAKNTSEINAAVRAIKKKFVQYGVSIKNVNRDLLMLVDNEDDAFSLFTILVEIIPFKYELKQEMLEESNLLKKLNLILEALTKEAEIASIERKIIEKVEENIDKNQRNYFLREQAKVIKEELGDSEETLNEDALEYNEKISKIKGISAESREKLMAEVKKFAKMPESSHEAYVISNYLDTVLNLPWSKRTREKIDLKLTSKQLDEFHYGLEKVKERILENLAVRSFNPKIKGQILCLVGPPGVGKTSIARSIAKAIGRKFVSISLGGVNDESDIRGHRKTYVGAMPGRIISGIIQAKSKNPLVLLDEVDKMSVSFRGDPASAILEVLDCEQNSAFIDHYIEVPFDISECFFIATANSVSTIPSPLLDRMEVIEISSYTFDEKFHIAREYLWPKQLKEHGLNDKIVKISDSALREIIDSYTKEAGVRKLDRLIASLMRKAAKKLLDKSGEYIKFTERNISKYLGAKKYLGETISKTDEVGLVNGLAWTNFGGELMQIEAGIMDGKGDVKLTGNLGDVMKESANAAISFVRSIASNYNIPKNFYKNKDIHIHIPEGAVPKDGPSAGVALATAVVSALSNTPVKRDVAMTGEISLRGRDLAIGGLKEKAIAAYKSGVRTVLIPKDNLGDLDDVDESVRKVVKFIPCSTANEVLQLALIRDEHPELEA